MREEDEVVVYLVVVGTVESVDRRGFDGLRRIHHSYRKFGYMFREIYRYRSYRRIRSE